jgi:PhzF family phenazine biosynthesis protein
MTSHDFQIIDVFGAAPFAGNPLGVVFCQAEPDAERMQRITRWLNLSETTFVLPPSDPDADYRVRIFSLTQELPFAGHPTLGTCHAWLGAGGRPRDPGMIVQQCGAGLVRIRRDGDALAFAAPPVRRSGPVEPDMLAKIAGALRISTGAIVEAQWVDNGPGWVAVRLESAQAVLAVDPVRWHAEHLDIGVVGLHPAGHPAAYEIRAFFSDPFGGIVEDPVCGSLNASVAQWLIGNATVAAPYEATQGARVGRDGRIRISRDAEGQVWIGGRTVRQVSGTVDIPA